jgi:hypothetical protein
VGGGLEGGGIRRRTIISGNTWLSFWVSEGEIFREGFKGEHTFSSLLLLVDLIICISSLQSRLNPLIQPQAFEPILAVRSNPTCRSLQVFRRPSTDGWAKVQAKAKAVGAK